MHTVWAASQVLLVWLGVVVGVAKHLVLGLVPGERVVAHVDVLVSHSGVRAPSQLQVMTAEGVLMMTGLPVALKNLVGYQVLWWLGAHLLLALRGLLEDALLLLMVLTGQVADEPPILLAVGVEALSGAERQSIWRTASVVVRVKQVRVFRAWFEVVSPEGI